MQRFGRIRSLRLVRDIVTGASRRYAFVEFEDALGLEAAYRASIACFTQPIHAHKLEVDGSAILVDYYRQGLMPGWMPRRLGGGLGGRKESGQLRFGGRDRPFQSSTVSCTSWLLTAPAFTARFVRVIPTEELRKLGIPLPPEGHYLPVRQVPPLPESIRRRCRQLLDVELRDRPAPSKRSRER
eukprot:SM000002S05572  [mRNA]  locus=s2:915343:916682:- [translate_table: standard]